MLGKLVSIISIILCLGAITNASISITPFNGEDDYFYYDVDVVLEGDKYVEGFGPNAATVKTYYEWMYITPSAYGTDYSFLNFNSNLQGDNGSTIDTQLLLYDSENYPTTETVIHNGPQIYNTTPTSGFGGGQTFNPGQNGPYGDSGAFGASLELNEEQYVIVFSSFQPNALGSMDIEIHGPNAINFTSIPEPSTYALMLAFGGFLYVAIRRRHA
jgi:hypothetical protein